MGNDKLPASEQIAIHFSRIPGTSEKGAYVGFSSTAGGQISVSYNHKMLQQTFIQKIDNLEMEVGSDTVKIKDGIDLSEANFPKLDELNMEIFNHLFPSDDELTEGESRA